MKSIRDLRNRYGEDNILSKWSFYHFSAPVYVVKQGSKKIIVDLRRQSYPEWLTVDTFGLITKDRFHALSDDKLIIADARKSKVLATFDRPKLPTFKMWKWHLENNYDYKKRENPALVLFMGFVTKWYDDKAKGIKGANKFKSIEDVARYTIKFMFETGTSQWLPY